MSSFVCQSHIESWALRPGDLLCDSWLCLPGACYLQEPGGYSLLRELRQLGDTQQPVRGIAKLMEWLAAGGQLEGNDVLSCVQSCIFCGGDGGVLGGGALG